MSFKAIIVIEIKDFLLKPDQLLQREFHWNIARSIHSVQHPEGKVSIQENLALIISPTSEEGRMFWQLCCKQFGFEYIGYKERAHRAYGFCLRSKYIINHTSMEGRHFQIASTGTFLITYTSLYALKNNKSFIIEDIVIEEVWTIKKGIYGEVLFKLFRFYQSFDFYAFDFPEMKTVLLLL
jgi:hypothetical protein